MPSLRPSICLLLLTVFWAAIYLPGLGKRELQGEEARRVLPGRTMMQTGEWIVPRSGGEVYNRKPPLVNWMSAAAIKFTGRMDEWTVRTPSTLMMLAMVLCVYLFLRGWLGNDRAMLAALITLTNIGLIEKGRLIEIEALYISLFGIALVAWLGLRWQGRDLAAWVVSGVVLGLGVLAKGPPHLLYFYAIVIGVLAAEKKVRELWQWKHLTGLACFAAVWVPWVLVNSWRNPHRDSGKVWADQITQRIGFVEFDFVNYLLQVPQSLINFLPWVLLLPVIWRVKQDANDRHAQWLRGLRKGLAWGFFIVALLPSSRPRFMLPLNVAAAVIVAEALAGMMPRWKQVSLGAASIALVSLLVAPLLAKGSWETWQWSSWTAALIAGAFGCRRLLSTTSATPLVAGLATSLAVATAVCSLAFHVITRSPWKEDLRDFAKAIVSHTGEQDPIMLYKVSERMWPFYLGMRCYEVALMADRPTSVGFRWFVLPRKIWEKREEQSAVEFYYGKIKSHTALHCDHDHLDYVLVETEGR